MRKAVALYSGGLDSTLAIRILQGQGFEIEAVNIRTTFDCCKTPAARGAADLGVRLTVFGVEDDYVDVLRKPEYGYGKGMNPCVDCRIYMAGVAKRFMEDIGACVVISGEVVGQRPMSQKKRDLAIIEKQSGLMGRLLRPLSARLLPPTIPEGEGLIDREKLYALSGRGRAELVRLAGELGVTGIAQPSTGCALTEVTFAPRVRDLLDHSPNASRWEFELLNFGRHIRFDMDTKIVVGRNAEENASLETLFVRHQGAGLAFLHPVSFLGPDVLVVGNVTDHAVRFAGGLISHYSKRFDPGAAAVRVRQADRSWILRAQYLEDTLLVKPL